MVIKRVDVSDLFNRVKGLDAFANVINLQSILDTGCFIAGGFVRKIWRDKSTQNLCDFFNKSSDIDIFAPNDIAFRRCYELLSQILSQVGGVPTRSPCSNAWTFLTYFVGNFTLFNAAFGKEKLLLNTKSDKVSQWIKFQLVDCKLGSPQEILLSFDLTNCMFALSNDGFYYDSEALELETSKTLSCSQQTDLLGARILKYYSKHDYDCLNEKAIKMLADWIVTNETNAWKPEQNARKIYSGNHIVLPLLRHLPLSVVMRYVGRFIGSSNIKLSNVSYNPLNASTRMTFGTDFASCEIMERNEIKPCDIIELTEDAKTALKCHCVMVLGVVKKRTKTSLKVIRVTTGVEVFEIDVGVIKQIITIDEANKFFQ